MSMKKRKQPSCASNASAYRRRFDPVQLGFENRMPPLGVPCVHSGFETEDDMLDDKAKWFCGCKTLPSKRRK